MKKPLIKSFIKFCAPRPTANPPILANVNDIPPNTIEKIVVIPIK